MLRYFEPDIQYMSRFMRMPKEDAEQSLRLELIDLLKHAEGISMSKEAICIRTAAA
ncbi:hypothetical protein WJ0W_006565 [Paenibacillus melissococcoides]|uniref:Uncharacterized protein n=1 Tax=Paenibacillus melissococcoides TaxID=2912268 RepID=A0ABM9GD71_9BACL|nr:hypothetical protein [Paenibacillus melissococcoides]CAH8249379.1 hypothetical protein WJ0W_006565 [Paenibacillus melissococcoides]